jgi:hypothetical protein
MLTPFAGTYHQRACHPGRNSCVHCGRTVREPWRWFVEVIHGGAYVRRNNDPEMVAAARCDEASYMGCYPVGPECRKILEADGVKVERWLEYDGPEPTVNNEVI